jgi:hypothetical protein
MISAIISYCTNDIIFLEPQLKQATKFSDEIIIPICRNLFNGEEEDKKLLDKTFDICKSYENVHIIMYDWQGLKDHNCFYNNLSRKIGTDKAKNDWLFFLDVDEIVGNEFSNWFSGRKNLDHSWWFSCYWYFREPTYQAICNEGCGLLIRKKYCDWNLYSKLERQQLFQKLYNEYKLTVSGIKEVFNRDGNKLLHHYSWVRSHENMLKKVINWSHKDDKKWVDLVNEEFSRPFNGTDFVFGYSYNRVENYFNISV